MGFVLSSFDLFRFALVWFGLGLLAGWLAGWLEHGYHLSRWLAGESNERCSRVNWGNFGGDWMRYSVFQSLETLHRRLFLVSSRDEK